MLKALAQYRGTLARFAVAALASVAILDSIGAGAFVAPALLPFLVWASVTARSWPVWVLLSVEAGLCLAIGLSVLLWFAGARSEAVFWTSLAVGGYGTATMMALRVRARH